MAENTKTPRAKRKAAPRKPAAAKAKRGPRSPRSREIEDVILARISAGELLRQICRDPKLPDAVTFYRWLNADEDLQARYQIAKDLQVEGEMDEIRELADRPITRNDAGKTIKMTDEERRLEMQQRRMRIDVRRWRVAKIAPRKYGQKSEVFLADHRATPVSDMPDDSLDAEIAELQAGGIDIMKH